MISNTNNILISKHQHPTKMTISVGAGESFTIPHLSGYKYDYTVHWGDSTKNRVYDYNDPNTTHTFTSADTYNIKIYGICEGVY